MTIQVRIFLFVVLLSAVECVAQEQTKAVAARKQTSTQKATVVSTDKTSGEAGTVRAAQQAEATKDSRAGARSSQVLYQQVYTSAVASYQQQSIDAHKVGDHKREAAAALRSARAAEALASADPSQIPAAEAAYRSAITAAKESAQVEERSLAANNLAVLLMKSGRQKEALDAVGEIDLAPSLSPQQRAVFSYNMARAYELNGDGKLAFARYADAYASNPDFTQAAVNAFRLLLAQKTPQVENAVRLSDKVVASGAAPVAHEPLLSLIRNWATADDAQRLLAALVRCYVAEEISPGAFKEKEFGRLAFAVRESPQLTTATDQIAEAYLGQLSPRPFQAAGRLSMWRGQGQDITMAALLGSAARWFAENEHPELALGRSMAAWNISRDPKYALEFASLIRLNPNLDPDGRLLNGLLDSMFATKGEVYARHDWTSIYQMHVAIATILERNGAWGLNGEVRGATFQWEHAIEAYDRLTSGASSAPPVPGLHAHLAICYSRSNRSQQATQQFLLAAEGFMATGNIQDARQNAELAKRGASALSEEDLRRLRKVEDAIAGAR